MATASLVFGEELGVKGQRQRTSFKSLDLRTGELRIWVNGIRIIPYIIPYTMRLTWELEHLSRSHIVKIYIIAAKFSAMEKKKDTQIEKVK